MTQSKDAVPPCPESNTDLRQQLHQLVDQIADWEMAATGFGDWDGGDRRGGAVRDWGADGLWGNALGERQGGGDPAVALH